MNIVAVIVAIVLAFLVLKLVVGILKFALLAVIVVAAVGFVAKKLR
ncbi:MAG TPA: hypothetical protein VFP53_06400 [Sphingomicrobium sp.]|nr:hypothetical protein [Sphingomicrobium sp.]